MIPTIKYAAIPKPQEIRPSQDSPERSGWPVAIAWMICLLTGFVYTWANRFEMGSDGVSYLDMGEAYWRGDFQAAANGLWSPLYAWIVSGVLLVVQPSSYWEFPVVHMTDFCIFIASMAAFHFFLTGLIRFNRRKSPEAGIPDIAWLVIGYALFLFSSLRLIGLTATSPDMSVAALVYVLCGIVIRIHLSGPAAWRFALFGFVWALAYLAKAPMLPIGVVFLLGAASGAGSWSMALKRSLLAVVFLAVCAGPYVALLSKVKGRLTFGDSGKLNYAWHVNGVPRFHWRGDVPGSGQALHASRKLLDSPATYEFATPIGGTYSLWYDPAYWYEGLRVRFDPRLQFKVITSALTTYFYVFFELEGGLVVAALALAILTGVRFGRNLLRCWFLWMPAVAALGMYSLVHAEPRYLAPFVVLIWLALFSAVELPRTFFKVGQAVCIAAIAFMGIQLGLWLLRTAYDQAGVLFSWNSPRVHEQWRIANGLTASGVVPGDTVAYIRPPLNYGAYPWARLAKIRIVAELPPREASIFWTLPDERQTNVLTALAQSGAKTVVAGIPPASPSGAWTKLLNTDYYVHRLQ